jgi:phosphatidylglycerol phospholipase C
MRCFGVDKNIIDCDWEYLSTLRSTESPHDPMPRLMDLLEYLASPEREHILVLLDIKVPGDQHLNPSFLSLSLSPSPNRLRLQTDDDARTMMEGIAETLKMAPTYSVQWYVRIILGCWRVSSFFPLLASAFKSSTDALHCADIEPPNTVIGRIFPSLRRTFTAISYCNHLLKPAFSSQIPQTA